MRGGGGLRLKHSEPNHLDDVAADFPDMNIIIAHPSWPWQEQALSIALHKPNVDIEPVGLVAETVLARVDRAFELVAEAKDAVRVGLPANPA